MSAEAALAALAEPRRRTMLMLIRDSPQSVNEIAAHFEISQQAVSQHLQVLKEAGLVEVHPDGQRRIYAVHLDGLETVQTYLKAFWPDRLSRLKEAVEKDDPDGP